jgi:hypothetical protein
MTNHITKLLNKAKNITGSDYMTAKRLQVSRQYVSKVRNGNAMSVAFAFDLAELIGEDPAKVLAAHQADQAHTPEERRRWERWGRRCTGGHSGHHRSTGHGGTGNCCKTC